jgi:hypothetical protein
LKTVIGLARLPDRQQATRGKEARSASEEFIKPLRGGLCPACAAGNGGGSLPVRASLNAPYREFATLLGKVGELAWGRPREPQTALSLSPFTTSPLRHCLSSLIDAHHRAVRPVPLTWCQTQTGKPAAPARKPATASDLAHGPGAQVERQPHPEATLSLLALRASRPPLGADVLDWHSTSPIQLFADGDRARPAPPFEPFGDGKRAGVSTV